MMIAKLSFPRKAKIRLLKNWRFKKVRSLKEVKRTSRLHKRQLHRTKLEAEPAENFLLQER